jgi:hypothetical protein
MSRSDQWVNIAIVLCILVYLSILIFGYFTHKFAFLAAILNVATGASIIFYWVIRQLQIQQHYFDNREIMILLFEVVVIVIAAKYIFSIQKSQGFKVMQSVIYGIHFLMLILGLVFMLTFKITKLF